MKIAMAEYQGRHDSSGTAVGHAPKVLKEYYNIISEFSEVVIYAPKAILRSLDRSMSRKAKVFPFSIRMRDRNSLFKKIYNKLGMFRNIRLVLKYSDADVVWFFNVEFYLMLYLAFCKKPRQKIVCTLFINGYEGGTVARIKQKIFEKAQKKMSLIIASSKSFFYKNCDCVYIPDYLYDPDKYKVAKKQPLAVCLGTMGPGKELDELVDAFNTNGYRLEIVGRFYDKEWFARLKEKAKSNIAIEDKYLEYDEYLELLSQATYCVLPYNPDKYGIQTSGVLQEAMFVETIPVSFHQVLKASGAIGVGFESWDELANMKLEEDRTQMASKIKDIVNKEFLIQNIKQEYKEIFSVPSGGVES